MGDEKQGSILDALVKSNATTVRKTSATANNDSAVQETINGYRVPEVVSALQKAIRRGQEDRALYWASELMASEKTWHMWKRLIVIAAEDIGLADPDMVMRVYCMKMAHDIGREWNIPFLAVVLLCRSPKNREMDDAAYLYEMKRNDRNNKNYARLNGGDQKWKLKMPPEALDGHTPTGRSSLYRMARETGKDWFDLWADEFYDDVALLKGYVPRGAIEGTHTMDDEGVLETDRFRVRLMQLYRRHFATYDLDTNPHPRLRSGGVAAQAETDELMKRVPNEARIVQLEHDPETAEKLPEHFVKDPSVFTVASFTQEDGGYIVDLRDPHNETCTCPAFENSSGVCKHIIAVRNWRKDNVKT